ncbi:MAG: HEPN domain-containing protein [Siculibacillus sp.]|nr:HEPN domain-containing protein [Siculibacillus sp.]
MPSVSSPAELMIANYIRLAHGDLLDAEQLRKTGSRNAAYLAEQSAEKVILALLVSEQVHALRKDSHRLDILVDNLPSDHPLREKVKQIDFLTAYATSYRYPKTAGRLPKVQGWEKIDTAIRVIRDLINEICVYFVIDLNDDDSVPAQHSRPYRSDDDGSGGGMSGGPA